MDVIRFDCPRCGKHLRVNPEKSGRHGRCPTCGGRIKVPEQASVESVGESLEGGHTRLVVAVVVGVLLVAAVIFFVDRAGGNGSGEQGEESVVQTEDLVQELREIRQRLTQLDDLEQGVAAYAKMALEESELRARDVRRRLNAYEPVSTFECALREKIMAERQEPSRSETAVAGPLNSPLTTLERERLHQLSDRLETLSVEVAAALGRARIAIRLRRDPLGRRLLNLAETEAILERERKLLRDAEADIRRRMLNPVAGKD